MIMQLNQPMVPAPGQSGIGQASLGITR